MTKFFPAACLITALTVNSAPVTITLAIASLVWLATKPA